MTIQQSPDNPAIEHSGKKRSEKKIGVKRRLGSGLRYSRSARWGFMIRPDGGTMKSGDKVVVRKADGTEGTATFTSKDGKTFNIDNKSVFVAGHGDMTAHHNAMKTDETFDVTSYEINPANIGEKFKDQKIMVRTAKPDSK